MVEEALAATALLLLTAAGVPLGVTGVRGGVAGRPGKTGAKALLCFTPALILAENWEKKAAEVAGQAGAPQDPWCGWCG